jgi:hypothetical protein
VNNHQYTENINITLRQTIVNCTLNVKKGTYFNYEYISNKTKHSLKHLLNEDKYDVLTEV